MAIKILAAVLGTFWFGIIFNVRGKNLIFSALVGGISWFSYSLCIYFNYSLPFSYFIASVVLTLSSEILAILLKTPVTSILICGLIPLVPGSGIYYTMFAILEKKNNIFILKGTETFLVALSISFGIVLVSSIVRIIRTGQKNRYFRKNKFKKN